MPWAVETNIASPMKLIEIAPTISGMRPTSLTFAELSASAADGSSQAIAKAARSEPSARRFMPFERAREPKLLNTWRECSRLGPVCGHLGHLGTPISVHQDRRRRRHHARLPCLGSRGAGGSRSAPARSEDRRSAGPPVPLADAVRARRDRDPV